MQQDIEDIQEQISAILARIQSISYVPKYSDGKAIMTYTDNGTLTPGTAEFTFELQPASTADELVTVWSSAVTVGAVYTVTKAAPETVNLSVESVTADSGYITLIVSGKGLKDEYFRNQCSANVRMKISDGNNELSSAYVQMVPWTTDVISFADAKFKAYCVENFDTDGDGEITEEEAAAVTKIECSLGGLTSLVGIEYFSGLEYIDVSCNSLTSLDLSHSTKLKTVLVNNNKLQSFEISGLAALETLDCSTNKLGSLDVSESPVLENLNCSGNKLGTLNLKNNKALTELDVNNNSLATLDLRNNTALETLHCRKNSLGVLDVTKLTALKDLDCSNNPITALNLSALTALEVLRCGSNSLQNLAIGANVNLVTLECEANSLKALDLSKNVLLETLDCSDNALTSLDVSQNPALTTIDCSGNAEMAKLWVKDADQKASLDITKEDATQIQYNDGGINIPDAALKSYLLALFDDDEDGEISIVESENIENVNCAGKGISDLTGLECCPNLKYLNFNGNSVKRVELPNLAKLETIVAYGNPIERLNVNNDTALNKLYLQNVSTNAISGNVLTITAYSQAATLSLAFAGTEITALSLTGSTVLTSYDIAENTQLVKLTAYGNTGVTGVDISTLVLLQELDIHGCALTSLNLDSNVELTGLDCSKNALTALNVDNNVALVTFDCSDNGLSTLKVSNNTDIETLDCSNNSLLNINVRKNTALKTLNVSGNSGITALALGYNTTLETLDASSTALSDIDLSKNVAIKTLKLSSTPLALLDVSNNTSLTSLDYKEGLKITTDFSIGRYIKANGVSGVTFYVSGTVTKIVSVDETSTTWDYLNTTTGATSATDGAANTDKIASGSSAAKWCRAKGAEWYLPAKSELATIYNNKSTLNKTLSAIGGTQLSSEYYWSSTENDSKYVYFIDFNNETKYIAYRKDLSISVRAVRAL